MITHPFTRSPGSENANPSNLYSSWVPHLEHHWGRHTWDALFLLASDFPHARDCEDDQMYTVREVELRRNAWKRILLSLPDAISCPLCGMHFRRFMQRHSVNDALRNRETLMKWLYMAKDEVNKRRGKRSPSLERIRKKYIPPCSRRPRHKRSRSTSS